jgi:hypothetical protein
LLDAPQSIPNLAGKLEGEPEIPWFDKAPSTPLPPKLPDIRMKSLPEWINPGMPPRDNPFTPGAPLPLLPNREQWIDPFKVPFPSVPSRQPPSAPDRAPPAAPDRPPTKEKEIDLDRIGRAGPSTRSASSFADNAPHWLASLASLPSPSSVSDAPPWLDPGPVGKSLRRLLGFPK